MRRCTWLLAEAAAVTTLGRAPAQVIVYDNTTIANFSGFGYPNGGATLIAGDTITRMVADDIVPVQAAIGQAITSITFSIGNFNAVAVTARPLLRFYDIDGT